jgi:hypothetical protein
MRAVTKALLGWAYVKDRLTETEENAAATSKINMTDLNFKQTYLLNA